MFAALPSSQPSFHFRYFARGIAIDTWISSMTNGSPAPTCLAHFVLAGVTGWSLKHLPAQRTDSGFQIVFSLMVFLLVYGLFGLVRFSHPQPSLAMRKLYERFVLLARVCPLPFLNAQLLFDHHQSDRYCPAPRLGTLCHNGSLGYVLLASALVAFVAGCVYSELSQRHIADHVATGVLLLNLLALGLLACDTDNYWGVGLAVSFGTKHFALPWLADQFCIPFVDLYTFGLIFYEIFTVNVLLDAQFSNTNTLVK
uniref:Uncharacterized protein n=2 Tax=Anopheles atroparvus TaxID=41427 RepID=A0A182J0M6_ANOAO